MMYGTPFGQPVSFGSAADRKPSFAAVFAVVASTSFGFPDIVGQLLRQLTGLADGESFFFKAGGSRRGKLSVQSGKGTTASLAKKWKRPWLPGVASQLGQCEPQPLGLIDEAHSCMPRQAAEGKVPFEPEALAESTEKSASASGSWPFKED
jgi:hypothetical protein